MARTELEKKRAGFNAPAPTRGRGARARDADGARRPAALDDAWLEGTLMAQPLPDPVPLHGRLPMDPVFDALAEGPKGDSRGP